MEQSYYTYVDCRKCKVNLKRQIPMTHNKELRIWECKECGHSISEIPPPPTPNEWQKYEQKTSVSEFQDNRQEVTLRCPAGCGIFISTNWPSCPKCGFKWGDEV